MNPPQHLIGLFITHQADQRLLAAYLSDAGYAVYTADLVAADPDAWLKLDVVLADERAGRRYHQQLLALKTRHDALFLPVLIVLAHKVDSTPWLKAGFDDILRMPLTKAELGARLAMFLRVRVQSQASFTATERRFRALVEYSSDGITLLDAQGRSSYRSPASERLSGYTAEERVGHDVFDLFHPDDRPIARAALAAVLEVPGSRQRIEYRSRHKDGRWLWTEAVITNLLHEPAVQAIIANFRDITERKQAEQTLVQSEKRFSTIFRTSPAALSLTRVHDGRFLDINEAHQRLFGYSRDEIIGQSSTAINIYANSAERASLVQLLHEQGAVRNVELALCTKSGEVRTVLCSMEAIELEGEAYMLAIVHDITERKHMEAALIDERALLARRVDERTADLSAANAELARTAILKDEFLSSMSHELRTPLNAVLGLSEALQEGVYGPVIDEQRQSLHSIEESGRHLLELINDILDLAKIGAGKLELELEPTSVELICQSSLRLIMQLAHQKRLSVDLTLDPTVTMLHVDARRAKQILVNLLSNAIKFTPEGGSIGLEVLGDAERQAVDLTVWDTGIGIAHEHMGNLFQPFVQIDSQLARQYEGTGLGLALVYRMVELHGGSMAVTSEVGCGSRFTVALPWPAATAGERSSAPAEVLVALNRTTMRRALIVEDSPTTAEQLTRYLHELAIESDTVREGTGVVEIAIREQPDLILLDLLLPESSGWDVLAQLKAEPRTRAIPVLIISVIDDRARGLALGASAYLVKPVVRADLERLLPRLAPDDDEGRLQPTAHAIDPTARTLALPIVLLAEDNEATITMITDYLSTCGYQIIVARNGTEAIARAREARPAIVLMDIQMPGMDGIEATRRIREIADLADLPIIALTALAMPGDRERCLAAGANAYLSKPVSLRGLASVIETTLRKHVS